VLTDPRLWIPVCGFDGCHVEEQPVPIPKGFWDAVADYGLEPDLPRWLHTQPRGGPMANCKSCGAEITWAKTPNGKRMPLESDERGNIIIEALSPSLRPPHGLSLPGPVWGLDPSTLRLSAAVVRPWPAS
jgi:hypothetical protein